MVVHPGDTRAHDYGDEAGVVHQLDRQSLGESWYNGPVLLSWPADREPGYDESGMALVIHDSHTKIDMLDGEVNRLPRSRSAAVRRLRTRRQRRL